MLRALLILAICVIAYGCNRNNTKEQYHHDVYIKKENISVAKLSYVDYMVHGSGVFQSKNKISINSKISGFVDYYKHRDSEFVKKGELLLSISNKEAIIELDRANAGLTAAKANFEAVSRNLESIKSMRKNGYSSSMELLDATAKSITAQARFKSAKNDVDRAELNLGYSKIYAPISGQIYDSSIYSGSFIMAGSHILNLVSIEDMEAMINIDESEISCLKPGLRVQFDYLNKACSIAKIDRISNIAINHQFKVFVDVNKDCKLKDGIFASSNIVVPNFYSKLMIPNKAIHFSNGIYFVYIYKQNSVKLVVISLGYRTNKNTEVISGIGPGDSYINTDLGILNELYKYIISS